MTEAAGNTQFHIAGRPIGPGQPTYIIAEMSGNHDQSFDQAVEIIRVAKKSGADAIKLQTYTADTLTIDCDAEPFQIPAGNTWEGRTLHQLYQTAYTPWEWQPKLFAVAADLGLDCFSTPFDRSAADFLMDLDVPAFKIASFELVDTPLIEYVASKRKPVIMSTGLSELGEIHDAVRAVRRSGNDALALLKCNSAYPAQPSEMNLRTIPHLAELFGVPVGLSDHTLGSAVAICAVTLGACIVEKHFTLSRSMPSPDVSFSMEPAEFRAMVDGVRMAEEAVGDVSYKPTEQELGNRVFRRSLFLVEDVKAGELLTERNVRSIRPGNGLPPRFLSQVLGRTSAVDAQRGTPLKWDLVAGRETSG